MKTISAKEFDKLFDDGEVDIIEYLDLSTSRCATTDPAEIQRRSAEQRAIEKQIAEKNSSDQ